MKRTLLFIACVLASVTMLAQEGLPVEDLQNSGCLARTRGEEYVEPTPTIVLTKEGSILSVQLLNYKSICGTVDFTVTSTVNGSSDGAPCAVNISVAPNLYPGGGFPGCLCPYNISFTVRDLETNTFYLNCWWYEGLVTLEEGKPLELTIDNKIEINEQNFPDKNFRNWVLSQEYGADGVLTNEELENVTSINISRLEIHNLKGIEYFAALKVLNCMTNKLTSLDLSKNTALEKLECVGNRMTTINLLENKKIKKLNCGGNNLTAIDVSGCTELDTLACSDNQLTALDVSKNTKLRSLECYSNQLTSLDLSKNLAISRVHCNDNQLMTLDVSKNTALTLLECSKNMLTTIDVTKNSALIYLSCADNKLTTLYVSNNKSLKDFSCSNNQLTSLDVSGCSALKSLGCSVNLLTTLYLSGCSALEYVTCNSNQLEMLDLSENTALTTLFCYQNQIKGIGMDALVESLPTVSKGSLNVMYFKNEPNVMTTAQVAAAKSKGWTPYIWTYSLFEEYVGSETPQIAYRPLVEDGKHWTYDNFMPLRPAEYDHYYYYDLRGDTLIAEKKCLKMYSENEYNDSIIRYKGALYEEGKKVYCFFPQKDEAVQLYDFDCKVGDTLHVSAGQMVVKDIQTEDNGGIAIRKYTFYNVENDIDFCWIEGVGAKNDFFGMLPLPGNYNTLNACELNGEKLYQTIVPDYTENGYHKMGIEGKRWNYIHYYIDADGEHRDPYSYVVKGDTIIRRTIYKKLWYQDEKTERLVCLLLESGREVMKSIDFGDNSYDSPLMTFFFEFGREDFGRVFTWKAENSSGNTNWMVYGVDTIEVKGQPFRRYTCLQKYSEEGETLTTIEYDGDGVWHDIWVEGVGSETSGIEDQIPSHEPPVRTPNDYTYFVSCYEDGECIFTADDFNNLTADDNMAYHPLVEDGKVWKVGALNSGNPVQLVEYYYFDGDTIIDGKTCKQMMRQQYVSPDFPEYEAISQQPSLNYVGAWYEEDKKVYEYDTSSKQFKLKYDFTAGANDTLQINDQLYVIGPKQTGGLVGFKGVYREVRLWEDGESIYSIPWLEGVGGTDCPTTNVYPGYVDPMWFLMSCTVGDEVIYFNDEYEDGATPDAARKQRIDFTHTIKTKPKAPRKEEAEPSLYGEYNNLRLDINLNPLDEAYQVRITDEMGRVVYEKAIDAASIVGLNIDISSYSAGRYTVTVENSSESFTGEFETQSTGISDTLRPTDKKDKIYNLQGQRISTSQKGLRIEDGRLKIVK